MLIKEVIQVLAAKAPLSLQESYDNAGMIIGDPNWNCTGILCSLDATEEVIREAMEKGCNLVVAHHPIVFSGLKKINGKNYVEKTVIAAIKNDIAIYAIHTNLDNILDGVNQRFADRLGLINRRILAPKAGQLKKLYTYVPIAQADFSASLTYSCSIHCTHYLSKKCRQRLFPLLFCNLCSGAATDSEEKKISPL